MKCETVVQLKRCQWCSDTEVNQRRSPDTRCGILFLVTCSYPHSWYSWMDFAYLCYFKMAFSELRVCNTVLLFLTSLRIKSLLHQLFPDQMGSSCAEGVSTSCFFGGVFWGVKPVRSSKLLMMEKIWILMDYIDQEQFENIQCPSVVSTKPVTILPENHYDSRLSCFSKGTCTWLWQTFGVWVLHRLLKPLAVTDNVAFIYGHADSCISCMH